MSMQSGHNKKIEYIPIRQIIRPIQPQLDQQKVDAMVSTMKGVPTASQTCTLEQASSMNGELPAVDIFKLTRRVPVANDGKTTGEPEMVTKDFYFSFASCHRLTSYERLQNETPDKEVLVKCKVYPAIESQLRLYMGASLDHWIS
ncbi:hypothetical protein ACO0RG_003853 [Hanseniaspora osmophila]|uniref:Sulfiredoxin n=1 Tax=Hanseniaspora osmophila TaxID=56408 RepID=A0A1E5RBH6_9ASCO|nr:Sulfiredoxin [Hanseniaspora osmophila]